MKISANINFLFHEVDFLDRYELAGTSGFAGIEIQMVPHLHPNAFRDAADAANVETCLLSIGTGDFGDGGPGLSGVPGKESDFMDEALRVLDIGEACSSRFIHIGPSRVPPGVGRADCLQTYEANVAALFQEIDRRGLRIELLLEAMNPLDAPTALFPDIETARNWAARALNGRLGLIFDIYHVSRSGTEDLPGLYSSLRRHVRHVQFSNTPNRCEPGNGPLDIVEIVNGLRDNGYDGWVGAEYRPSRPSCETLNWLPALFQHPEKVLPTFTKP